MAGARRRSRRHWPDYLLARQKGGSLYYYWKHPVSKREYGLGYDFAEAAAQAREANAALAAERAPKARLIDRIKGRDSNTVAAWLDVFEGILNRRTGKKGRERSPNTIKTDRARLKILREHFDDKLIANVTTRECADLLEKLQEKGQARQAQSIRSFMVDCFNEAITSGWLDLGKNPAGIVKTASPIVKRARINLQQFNRILERAKANSETWMETALMLAVLSGQRVGDIAAMQFDDVRPDEHDRLFLHVIQDKEGHPIRIPLELGLPQWPGTTLGSIIERARKRGIVGAKHICHHQVSVGFAKAGAIVSAAALSKNFTKLLREEFNEEEMLQQWPGKTPPTFHEIRSLAKSLYEEIGVNTMTLLGHKSLDVAAIYADKRGEWWTVELPKKAAS